MHHELKEKVKPISSIKEKLVKVLESEMERGIMQMDTKEAGEIIDMIKDLSEAERNCYEVGYYESVIKAMEEGEQSPRYGEDRMGYNNRRYSDGRYAPKGRGHISGYNPLMRDWPYIQEDLRMGYMPGYDVYGYSQMNRGGGSSNGSTGNSQGGGSSNGGSRGYSDDRYGKAYRDYQDSRRFYHESKSDTDRKQMETHANEHLSDTVATLRDIWKDAEPELRKRMKHDLTKLNEEMSV